MAGWTVQLALSNTAQTTAPISAQTRCLRTPPRKVRLIRSQISPGGGGYSLAQRSHRNLYRRRQSDTRRQHPSRRYYLRCFRQRLYALAQDTVYHLYGEYRIRKNSVRREQSCRTEHGGRFFHNLVV